MKRGYKDTIGQKLYDYYQQLRAIHGCPVFDTADGIPDFNRIYPPWLTDKFCSAHRCNLLRKDYGYYSKFAWAESWEDYSQVDYIWPTKDLTNVG